MSDINRVVDFFFECGLLQKLQRSGISFLGSGDQTVGSHVFRTAIIGFVLAEMEKVDILKVVLMCLFHDIEESRTGDLNYMQQRYVESNDEKALKDVIKGLPIEGKIDSLIKEYEEKKSVEAKIAHDADTLELILFLKEELDKGNAQAENWIFHAEKRLLTDRGKKICEIIKKRKYYEWWYSLSKDWSNGTKRW